MKAAVFTFCNFRLINYGQILQCYAFQEMCRNEGLDIKVIRYRQLEDFENVEMIPPKNGERELYERKYKDRYVEAQDREQVYKFKQFMDEYISFAPISYTVDELKDETYDCDLLIVGSDQVWNPAWFNRIFLLEFARENQRKITYATGGISCVTPENETTIRLIAEKIKDFDVVSVREKISADILKQYIQREIADVLDPTLMIASNDWNKICDENKYKGDYLLCFNIGLIQPHKHLLRSIAKTAGIKRVIYIRFSRSVEKLADSDCFTAAEGVGPRELLAMIRDAKVVCTDSFHGAALSIVFNKEFYLMNRAYVQTEGTDHARMNSLMKKLDIGNRKVNSKSEIDNISIIDWDKVNERLTVLQEQSKEFFHRAIYANE